jgi:hypothetical protein
MIEFEFLKDPGVLVVKLTGTLTAEDFRAISSTVDLYISEKGSRSDCWSRQRLSPAGLLSPEALILSQPAACLV